MSEISDRNFIKLNLEKLHDETIIKILLNYKSKLDECKARVEKPKIGTYIFTNKLTDNLAFMIRKSIEGYLN